MGLRGGPARFRGVPLRFGERRELPPHPCMGEWLFSAIHNLLMLMASHPYSTTTALKGDSAAYL